ncbi:MAG: GMC family oxidoreductase [Deltaproteobacteria bacterium]|nr:GMC family oxidoreductase [Deltaproteobacteria bacterium]
MASKFQWDEEADYVVVGSGAAGASCAVVLAQGCADILLLEEGGWHRKSDFTETVYDAIANLFRDFGFQTAHGQGFLAVVLEGCCVGGSTVINGAIVHRFPQEIHSQWCEDKGIADGIPYASIQDWSDRIEKDLSIRSNTGTTLPSLRVATSLKELGWAYGPMKRNAPFCKQTGRCLQGCPSGGKLSMERSYIPQAMRAGCRIRARHKVLKLCMENNTAVGVLCKFEKRLKHIRARKAVILAAGTTQTPLIMKRSGFTHPHIGRHFQCHLGVGIAGLFDRACSEVQGFAQGLEIYEFQSQGIKLATQLTPLELIAARSPLVGGELIELLKNSSKVGTWMGSIRSSAEGTVAPGFAGRPNITFQPSVTDLERARLALRKLSELLIHLGATPIYPAVHGPQNIPTILKNRQDIERLAQLPLDPKHFFFSIGHMFGTCRMGTDPKISVVDPQFKVHGTRGLYIVDASTFPSNTGVNPQHSIMAMAMHAADGILQGH